jgi:aminoglycoside phosphotransferase (APT) family kinase protein
VAAHPAGRALLIERAAGSDAFAALSDEGQRQELANDYMEALADLHGLDTPKLELPGFARPAAGPDHARADLALWRRVYDQRLPDGDALCAFTFRWLDAHAPAAADRTSLCHGDAGPGNFLFADRRVTALLDWEFAHLGDPLDDLAWVAVRAQLLGGFGDQTATFAAWSRRAGLPVVAARVEYYRAFVLLRMAISCLVALAHAGERQMNTMLYQLLLPYLRLLLPQALERAGCSEAEQSGFLAEAEREIETSPVLHQHARPLDALELP